MTTATLDRQPRGKAPRAGLATSFKRSWDKHWYAWAMVAPVVLVIGVLVLYPLGYGAYLSFTNATELNAAKDIGPIHKAATYSVVGFDNYWKIISGQDGDFYPRLTWTVIWTVTCVAFTYGIGMGMATLLNRPVKFRLFYRLALILPWAIPAFVGIFAWRLMLNSQYGVFNTILTHVGIPAQNWLGTPFAQKVAVIMVNVWVGVPFMMVALLGGMQSVPKELYEAAEMDGASPWQRFHNVTLPGLRPVSNTVILLGVIWTFNMFPIIFLLLGQNTTGDTDILVTYAYRKAFTGVSDYSGAASYGMVILAILLVFSTFYRRYQAKTEQA
ncbi:sugar ABC transporter permease [Streptomyces sp. H10-C2]|uniref:carbohydrate ABC transporter permease n=1 Tax=unclassified Streptomyces TaxID=2593676 RepID=UPI0024BAB48A|nr:MULTISPECIES: sugar ABC transporter permease [unclassified Streptomyces]MDJ0341232.1 sugar ABC transporter permease [Streptomyces sp. PH10-H1]MDJ0369415.1 sugar ABC transporter permease [Streptomyces sp. H10-C2]